MRRTLLDHSGFTVVEILIVVTVTGILIGLIFGPLDDLYNSNVRSTNQTIQTGDVRGALRTIENDVAYASAFLTANSVTDPNLTSPATWDATSTANAEADNDPDKNILITSSYATTAESSPSAPTRQLVFDPADSTNSITLKNNTVYFVKDNSLYRRTLKNTGSASIAQKQTCKASGMSTSGCQAVDAKLLGNVTKFAIKYYAQPKDTTSIPAPTLTTSTIEITLAANLPSSHPTIITSSSLRISPVNIGATP